MNAPTQAPSKECFWKMCSDRKRCEAFGSCVAMAQAGGATFPQAMPGDASPVSHLEILSAVSHHAREIARLTAAVPVACSGHEPPPALRPDGMPEPSLDVLKRVAGRMYETAPDTAYLAQWAVEQIEELHQSFDLRWKADMRAIKRWQAAHPGNDLTWPDHADMVVWLLEQLDARAAQPPAVDDAQRSALVYVLRDLKAGIAEHATDVVWYSAIQTACDRIEEIVAALAATSAARYCPFNHKPCEPIDLADETSETKAGE